MTIIRVVIASCDHEGCPIDINLEPEGTQVFQELMDAGWGVEDLDEVRPKTFCPEHWEEFMKERPPV